MAGTVMIEYEKALKAIIARIDGEWDNSSLLSFGYLTANTIDDVKYIAINTLYKNHN